MSKANPKKLSDQYTFKGSRERRKIFYVKKKHKNNEIIIDDKMTYESSMVWYLKQINQK